MIEVIVSAMLVALIVVATLTGFDVLGRTTADQRFHNAAALLAAQSQEQLRTEPASGLDALKTTPHVYTKAVEGTTYTVTQSAEGVSGSGQSTACTVTEQTSGAAPNLRITSSVTWPQLNSSRAAVTQSSIITPPIGSTLEVDVVNAEPVTAGVQGVTAIIKYTPTESGSVVTREGATSAAGCVVFGSIRATSVVLEIEEKLNFVTPAGTLKVPPTEVVIAPNITTHHQVIYNEGGAIEAKFTYEGKTVAKGKTVAGDTFVATNTGLTAVPHLELGATRFSYQVGGEEEYTAIPGGTIVGGLAVPYAPPSTSKTATGVKYAQGDLFPFPKPWFVFAGDCAENNAATVTKEKVLNGTGVVKPGTTTVVEVPMSYVNLEVYKGTQKSHPALATTAYPVKITNNGCSVAPTPNNATAVNLEHLQNSTTEGHLEAPFQPFGKYELCLQATANRRDRVGPYTNSTFEGTTLKIYPEELSEAETKAQREKEEATTKATREATEAATRKIAEEKETTTKVNREKAEAPGREKREKEEKPRKKPKKKKQRRRSHAKKQKRPNAKRGKPKKNRKK